MSPSEMTETQALKLFRKIRWGERAESPACPRCSADTFALPSRPGLFRCGKCKHQFSVTSGTLFANRKLPAHQIVRAINLLLQGMCPYRIAIEIGCSAKVLHVLAWKMREAGIGLEAGNDLTAALRLGLTSAPSERFVGYWQRRHTPRNARAPKRGPTATNEDLEFIQCPSI